MPAPRAAERQQGRVAALTAVAIAAMRSLFGRLRIDDALEQQWAADVGPLAVAQVLGLQTVLTRDTDTYAAEVLNELDFGPGPTQPGVVPTGAMVGFTGEGLPVQDLLGTTIARTRADGPEAGDAYLQALAASILADTAQQIEAAALAARPWVDGYVRIAEPGACSRCLLITGKFYLWNDGFERHPRCRCTHVPAPADPDARKQLLDLETPDRRFDALTREEQDRTFGRAGAQAIRDGADIGQVVNARRGMQPAQVFGRDLLITTEGTTRRGFAYTRLARGTDRSTESRRRVNGRLQRNYSTSVVRLMPEAILQIAGDDVQERIRLLRFHGYIL